MTCENSDQKVTDAPEIDLRKVFETDRELPPAESPVVEAEIFRSRAHSVDNEIQELKEQIEDLKEERESNRDKWHENLERATDEMLKREGANPVDGNGVLDYTINGARVQVESVTEDSIHFTMYSTDSPLNPDEVREAENLAEKVERELSNERQKIEDRKSKIEAAEEYKSILEDRINTGYACREVVRELHDSHIMERLNREKMDGEHLLYDIMSALSEARLSYEIRDKAEDFHRKTDLEPEESAAIVIDTLRNESEDSLDFVKRKAADGGIPDKTMYSTDGDGKDFLDTVYNQLDVSESDFQPYSPRELVNEITEGCTEIIETLDEDWRGYDDPLERAEKFVNSVEEYLESIEYHRDTLEGIPYERAEKIVDLTQ